MSDEELKKFICSMFKCEFCDFELGERCGLLNWLQMPADMISNATTVDAVPVSELKKLRDYLYAEDLIFMRGLAELNKLIANYGAKMDEVSE